MQMAKVWLIAIAVGALAVWLRIAPSVAQADDFTASPEVQVPKSSVVTISTIIIPGPQDAKLEAWCCLPAATAGRHRPPVVIMGHGFGLQKDFGLVPFAEVFAKHGIATLLFDYRHFGGSSGTPRNLLNPWLQLEDWRTVINYTIATSLDGKVDATQIGLAGSSYSGGHVTALLANPGRLPSEVKCGVANVPYLASLPIIRLTFSSNGWGRTVAYFLHVGLHAVRDVVQSVFRLGPHYIPIAGTMADSAALASPSSANGYLSLVSERPLGGWQNAVPARILFLFPFYCPAGLAGSALQRVDRPLLFTAFEGDDLTFSEPVRHFHSQRGTAPIQLLDLPSRDGHWAAYQGFELHNQVANQMAAFLATHLLQA